MAVLRVVPFLVLSSVLILGTACDTDDGDDGGGGAVDSGMTGGPDALVADPNCEPAGTSPGNGMHNAGRNCITAGCHDGNSRPPKWTIAGTLYSDRAGSGIIPGATMVFTDANGTEVKIITADNGNFYTGQAITFPVTAKASLCPNSITDPMMITEADAACNATGCHDIGGRRIFLPQ
jgi:hypothetical protein